MYLFEATGLNCQFLQVRFLCQPLKKGAAERTARGNSARVYINMRLKKKTLFLKFATHACV